MNEIITSLIIIKQTILNIFIIHITNIMINLLNLNPFPPILLFNFGIRLII